MTVALVVLFIVVAAAATITRAIAIGSPDAGQIPWHTLQLNCLGGFVLGAWLASGWWVSADVIVAVAGLGSLTTFSTVAGETAGLFDDGHRRRAVAYVVLTLVAGVAAARLGLEIGAQL